MKTTKIAIYSICILLLLSACAGTPPAEESLSGNEEIAAPTDSDDAGESAELEGSGDLIPDGVLVSTGSENSLAFLDGNGAVVQEIETPGIIAVDPDDAIIAGQLTQDGMFPPVIFHRWTPEQALAVNTNGSIEEARGADAFLSMVSAPGSDVLAFSEAGIDQDNNWHGYLFAATPENLGNAPSFYDIVDDPSYWVLKPAGVKTTAGAAKGVFYSFTGMGIGGADMIFPVDRGLYFFDLTSGENLQYAGNEYSFQGISPDLSMAAFVNSGIDIVSSISIFELAANQTTQFNVDPKTDRGAGFAVFSPDNRYAAWLEATGSMISDPWDFHPRVRIGDLKNGGVVHSVEDSAVVQVINSERVTMMRPAGWLDNETLLIEVRGQNWDDVTLLRFAVNTGDLNAFASGSFLDFGYR